jgi:hypothetical protein
VHAAGLVVQAEASVDSYYLKQGGVHPLSGPAVTVKTLSLAFSLFSPLALSWSK